MGVGHFQFGLDGCRRVDYYGHMTYFETPADADAYYAGVTTEQYEAMEDSIGADVANLVALGRPDLDVEDRDMVPEGHVSLCSEQDRADLARMDDLAAFEGMGR